MAFDSSIWVWIPLAIAIALALIGKKRAAFATLAVALLGAWFEARLSITGLLVTVLAFAIASQVSRNKGFKKYLALTVTIVWSLGMALHWLPGFANLLVLDKVQTGPASIPFTMYLNLDKPLIFFVLLLAFPGLLGKAKSVEWQSLVKSLLVLTSLLPIAVILGGLGVEVSLPNWWWLFLLNNLLLTCVAEEAIFRGFIQQEISKQLGWKTGLIAASILFGIAHLAGGWLLIGFATIAGACYGMAFYLTGRLWAAVLVHFMFNFMHLLFFTYPIAIR
ncbi:lysostaphin resistance A-like protein [Vibrio breoganii]|uniref:CPBP family intramembrane glutamic endopeptidase n=1 Tax=Vibrio breoganii TaxID=553239 RepID=UPI000C8355F0|nr:CPBP family intramembrane glutamic endopeptidase [Vibrio breoganii]PMG77109.1 CAAX protease [Vibrio breoganii]PMG83014.1 CAAX protease [Vibrio breoganii]PMK40746.1 CAAX protease [Vibrio breoganii]PMM18623.1 CAAX protease [Vibrio breoganii]PMO36187.1 CAAX protease [Vibrio breoganii]